MASFEITVESPETKPVRLLVGGENWVDAWHEGARALGDDPYSADAVCVVKSDGSFHVQLPRARRTFIVRGPVDVPPSSLAPARGHPLLVPEHGGPPIRIHTPTSRGATRPLPRDAIPSPATAGLAPAPTAPTLSTDTVDRALQELERERVVARPVRIAAATGLPEPLPDPTLSRRTRRPSGSIDMTMVDAIAAVAGRGPSEHLPQQFHPVMRQDTLPANRTDALRWAVDTAFQHIPATLVLAVALGTNDARGQDNGAASGTRPSLQASVLAAAGHLGRDAEGWWLLPGAIPTPREGRLPTRMRFAADPSASDAQTPVIRFAAQREITLELGVTSCLVAAVDGLRALPAVALMLFNSPRPIGFTEGELSAVAYLSHTLAQQLNALDRLHPAAP